MIVRSGGGDGLEAEGGYLGTEIELRFSFVYVVGRDPHTREGS